MMWNIDSHPGWMGAFTTEQSEYALFKNGARVTKTVVDPGGDMHGIGSTGTVLGSIYEPTRGVGYFVEWDKTPKVATFCLEQKLGQSR